MAYYLKHQVALPQIEINYVRLIDGQPGDTIEIQNRSYVLLNIERTGNNVEPVYNMEAGDERVSMRIVNGNALITRVNKVSFGITNESIDVSTLGWVKRGGFYAHKVRKVMNPGLISGRAISEGDVIDLYRHGGSKLEVLKMGGEPIIDPMTQEFILLKIARPGNEKDQVMFHSVKSEQEDCNLQRVAGDVVYVNNYLESIIPHRR
ncbi:hypothetical protein CL89_gp132 [Aeromonas phage PX29]|uniref:Uncharacterized protein n=1 Tax=Aeromonas phage PX29 TaxID=926067 RepID=E5DQ65_9CAUD|nr:hypothetical protein CL89_gp132 [Aeromonas phage PX29]ADQ52851.1 conserved hypothetical protein [Aeromonas phage PX29]